MCLSFLFFFLFLMVAVLHHAYSKIPNNEVIYYGRCGLNEFYMLLNTINNFHNLRHVDLRSGGKLIKFVG